MTIQSEPRTQALERLSALADGEADPGAPAWASDVWRSDASMRDRWHAYHQIGDVLRSDDLGCDAGHDEAFLQAFRARLADEPVVMAPSLAVPAVPVPVAGASRVRRRWRTLSASAAVAAGFVAVAGVMLVTQQTGTDSGGATLASVPGPTLAAGNRPLAVAVTSSPPMAVTSPAPLSLGAEPILVSNGRMLRDARLQQYLSAHKQFGGSTALGVPSGFLRSETVEVPNR